MTSRSTLRVKTPLTYASITTAMIACSERRRGSRNDGRQLPARVLGIIGSISPDPGLPRPRAIPVAISNAINRHLAALRAQLP